MACGPERDALWEESGALWGKWSEHHRRAPQVEPKTRKGVEMIQFLVVLFSSFSFSSLVFVFFFLSVIFLLIKFASVFPLNTCIVSYLSFISVHVLCLFV